MSPTPNLFVSGLGRCGTTLLMTMLDAGGFPVSGPRPSYEPSERWERGKPDVEWIKAQSGRAVKWIDPTLALDLPEELDVTPIILLLTRNARQQARSQLKLLGLSGDRRSENLLKNSIERDSRRMSFALKKSATVIPISFEYITENPRAVSFILRHMAARYFNWDFDADTATRVFIRRESGCLPNLEMERTILPVLATEMPHPETFI